MKKRYKILSIILALAIAIGSIVAISVVSSSAESFTDENGISWTVTECYPGWAIKPTDAASLSGHITIPATYNGKVVLSIDESAFQYIDNNTWHGNKNITSVDIPETVTNIAVCAFNDCTNLSSVNVVGDSLVSIQSAAFRLCTNLTDISFGNSLKYIGSQAFEGCSSLKPIELPNSISVVGEDAFPEFLQINEVGSEYQNNFVNVACEQSFTDENGIEWLVGEYNNGWAIKPANKSAINGHVSIPSIYNGKTINAIAYEAFVSSEKNLTSISLPDTIVEIGTSAFQGCPLTSVKLNEGLVKINNGAFGQCTKLTSITLPDSLKIIGSYAFSQCVRLEDVDLGNGVEFIDDSAFYSCRKFKDITIPSSCKYINGYAFGDIGTIEKLTVNCVSLSSIGASALYNDTIQDIVVGDTLNNIDTPLLSGNKNIASVGLGSNVTISNPYAFYGNSNMTIETTSDATNVINYATTNNIPYTIVNNADITRTVDFEVTCDKSGYEFTVYRVADLEANSNPYSIRYGSLLTDIEDEIFEGDSEALLAELDKVGSSLLTEVVGTYSTDVDGSSKLFEDLPAGIYYVRATNYPANVYGVQNSVFALPFYDSVDGWVYEIDAIPLATKVDESNPEIVKTIANSTKDNANFTDVSLGDTINFEIEASRVGSANEVESKDFKLKSYVVSDIMESGLTLNQDSFVVTLEDIDGNTLATLEDTTDYIVNIVANEGVDTTFTVSLTPEYLQENEFYSSANVVISYSAVLNEYSTREFDGNYNTATNLTYSNKTDVSATVDGNTVYAYTFGIEVNKYDDAGTPLAGSKFGLYLTENDAKAMQNAIATGTSTADGKVEFYTEDENVIRLASGTYYIVETKATDNYNRYTDVIPVTITVEYGDTEVNGTYIESAPENGIQLVEVKNSKVVIPNTGGDGALYRYLIAAVFAMLALTFVVLKKRNSKKVTAK
ncbi:MAG: SpaH/EbpB family LPXTG-anchored major pilin [Ruminococcus sp.]|nr:SpaH/EbpB family LPXTG-anchored major pilin [Ruminococcus sp.]